MTNQQSLYDLIDDWWDEIFCNQEDTCVEDLVNRIENWLPDCMNDEETEPDKLWCNDFRNGYNKYRNDVIGNLR